MLLQRVPETKQQKNRLHLDPRTADLDTEVARIVGLGATRLVAEPITLQPPQQPGAAQTPDQPA